MTKEKWKPIKTAPYDGTRITIKTHNGHVFDVEWARDSVVDREGRTGGQWQAVGDDYPECWTDGACWASNHNEEASDQPKFWMPYEP